MKTKNSKDTVRAFLTTIPKKRPEKIWVDKVTEFAGELEKLCNAEGAQIYSIYTTRRGIKAAFAERTIGPLKNILYRYIENKIITYIHKLTQFFATLNSRRNDSIDLIQ